jgi:hypothetical protein
MHISGEVTLSPNVKLAETAFNDKSIKKQFQHEALLKENKTAELQYYYGLLPLLETNKVKEAGFNELQSGILFIK